MTLARMIAIPLALMAGSSTPPQAAEYNVGGIGALKCSVAIEGYGQPDFLNRIENILAVTWAHGFISALNVAAQSETKTFVDIGSMTPQEQAQEFGEWCRDNPDEPIL